MNRYQVDVLVVGLGVGGFAAAISAAEEGKKVLVIEKNNQVGGNAIQSNVGTICGAFHTSNSEVYKPISHMFLQRVVKAVGGTPIKHHKGLAIVPYDWRNFQRYIISELDNKIVETWHNVSPSTVVVQDNDIHHVEVSTLEGDVEVVAKNYIDCSGNGIISQLANLEMISSSVYQSASQVFRIEGVNSINEYGLNFAIAKSIMGLVKENKCAEEFISLSAVPGSLINNRVDLKFTLPRQITDDTSVDELSSYGKKCAKILFSNLRSEIDSIMNARIELIYPQVGIRVQQRSKGQYILTEQDVLNCDKKENEIAIGTWPIEEWEKGKVHMTYLNNDYYSIPIGCLKSYQLNNLFFAGKNISATDKAIASARVIGTCLQTGYSAGKLASEKEL